MKFDQLMFTYLGEMGRYQTIQFILVCLPTIIVSMHALSWTFAAAPVAYRCVGANESQPVSYLTRDSDFHIEKCETTQGELVHLNVTNTLPDGVVCYYKEKCDVDGETCGEKVYDHSTGVYSAIERWDINCFNGWIKATIQAAYYVGQMAGSMIAGIVGDKKGRKIVFFGAIVLQISCGMMVAIVPWWWLYAIFRAGIGFSHPGIFVIAVVITSELVGPKYRKLASVITGAFFALGQVILGFEAYFIRDYRVLHLVITSPALIFLSYWWLVPESARWLVAKKRYQQADIILRKAARVNKATLPEKWWNQLDDVTDSSETAPKKVSYGVKDLFRTPQLRKRTCVAFFLWPVVSMVYYGMAMKANVLGGDLYFSFIFASLVEIPALVIVFLLIDRAGRRILVSGGFFIAGACLIGNYLLEQVVDEVPFVVAIIQMLITKGAITGVYASLYTYCPELFPTVIRNTAMGCCSTIARVGAIAASYIAMWIVESYGKVFMVIPFGAMAVAAGILCFALLPETMGTHLPETIAEIEGGDENDMTKSKRAEEMTLMGSSASAPKQD